MKKISIKKISILLIPVVVLIAKVYHFVFLPEKYFYDSQGLLDVINGDLKVTDKAFEFSATFFKTINFMGLNTLVEWNIFLSVIFNVVIILFAIKFLKLEKIESSLFFLASVGLLNIYVFNISKEIIQFIIFFVVFFVYKTKLNKWMKLVLSAMIFVLEAVFFRKYYILFIPILITGILSVNKCKKNYLIYLAINFCVFFLVVFAAKFITPDYYSDLIEVRKSLNINRVDSVDAKTQINDLFVVDSYLLYCLSYIVNYVRISIPIELLFKGVKYIPFILYQISITMLLIFFMKKEDKKQNFILELVISCSYLMVATTFEPDFGSLIRHEITMFPFFVFLFDMLMKNKNDENCNKEVHDVMRS